MSRCTHDAPLGDMLDYFDADGHVIEGPEVPGLPYCPLCGEWWPQRPPAATLWDHLLGTE
jgi:hypothetical protein